MLKQANFIVAINILGTQPQHVHGLLAGLGHLGWLVLSPVIESAWAAKSPLTSMTTSCEGSPAWI